MLTESHLGNVLAIHDLGKLYSTEKLGIKDEEKSFAYYKEALQGFIEIEPDSDFIFPHEPKYDGQIMNSVDMCSYVLYRIGKMYYCGLGTEQDYEKAFEWYQKSSLQGQPYASYAVGQMYSKGEYVTVNEEAAQKYYKKALLGFLEFESKDQADNNLLYKIGSMYKNGLGTAVNVDKTIDYFQRSAELGNRNADRILALEYISGEHLEQDIEKGLAMLTECADSGDSMSCYKLSRIYFNGKIVLKDLDKAEKYLLATEDNEFTQYALGKLYLQKEKYDIEKAISYFEKSADKNMWSSYQLGRIYFFGSEEIEKNKEKALEWLTRSADDGNVYAQNMLVNLDKFENTILVNTIFGMLINLSRCIEDDYAQKYKSVKQKVDSRLRKIISQKKQSLGIKNEPSHSQE